MLSPPGGGGAYGPLGIAGAGGLVKLQGYGLPAGEGPMAPLGIAGAGGFVKLQGYGLPAGEGPMSPWVLLAPEVL